jgi:hypothetical protein
MLEERVDGQMQMVDELRQTIARIDQRVDRGFEAMDRRFDRVDRRIDDLRKEMAVDFRWLVGIQVTMFVVLLGAFFAR